MSTVRRALVLSLLSLVLSGLAPRLHATSAVARPDIGDDPTQYVNPFVGTNGGGDTFPGADVPFGMVQWSPDTSGGGPGGYVYDASSIRGFSLTHISGAGCSIYGDIPFMPTLKPVTSSPATDQSAYASTFSRVDEQASPGYYGVRLDSGIKVDLTVTARTGFGSFTYPATTTANLLIDAGGSANGDSGSSVQIAGDDEVTGSATSGGFCGSPAPYTVYFAAQFSQPFTHFGTWQGAELDAGATASTGGQSGAFLTFDTTRDPVVLVKVGLSFVSVQNALLNLRAEDPGWDFAAARDGATASWRDMLQKIQVQGGTLADTQTFYTALYHALLHPNVFSDANGQYMGFDDAVHATQAYTQYANFSGWDIYRSEIPLLALVAPQQTGDMAQSLVADAQQGGHLPLWALANADASIMVGNPSELIIADAYAFGATRFDAHAALQAMVADATRPTRDLNDYMTLGYVPQDHGSFWSATTTLEYTSADFAIAQLAGALGDTATSATFMQRAQNWQNLYDPATGYVQQRLADGQFFPYFDPTDQYGYDEGNAAQYTWMIPYNLRALFDAMGGRAQAARRLDSFFAQLNAGPAAPYAWLGNEPTLAVPWAYDFVGEPWRTQAVVRQTVTELYSPTPDGLPGNDDLGTMSAWYVWAALGLYPAIPGAGGFALASPLFPQATLHLAGGDVVITAAAASDMTPYVQDLAIDGQPYTGSWVPFSTLAGGASLQFTLADTPDTSRGTAPTDAPPSFDAAEAPGIGFTSPGSALTVPRGGSQTFDIGVQGVLDGPLSVRWTASTPTGLDLEPTSGTITIPIGGGAAQTQSLRISASSDAPAGPLLVSFQLQSQADAATGTGESRVLPPVVIAASIVDQGTGVSATPSASPTATPAPPTGTPTATTIPPTGTSIGPSPTPPSTPAATSTDAGTSTSTPTALSGTATSTLPTATQTSIGTNPPAPMPTDTAVVPSMATPTPAGTAPGPTPSASASASASAAPPRVGTSTPAPIDAPPDPVTPTPTSIVGTTGAMPTSGASATRAPMPTTGTPAPHPSARMSKSVSPAPRRRQARVPQTRLALHARVVRAAVPRGGMEEILVQTQPAAAVGVQPMAARDHRTPALRSTIKRGRRGYWRVLIAVGRRAPLGTARVIVSARMGTRRAQTVCAFRVVDRHTGSQHHASRGRTGRTVAPARHKGRITRAVATITGVGVVGDSAVAPAG